MARNNIECYYKSNRASSAKSYSTSPKHFKSITPPMKHQNNGDVSPPRLSPSRRVSSPPQAATTTTRTSPGLVAGHYAGCKFTEPPLPSALPLPPQHWMQSTSCALRPFTSQQQEPEQLAKQLKMLLQVQA